MASIKKVRHEKETSRSFFVSVVAVVIAGLSLAWQVYQSTAQKRSYDKQFANIDTSLRLLTATVAPQLQKAIDDSLESVLNASSPQAVQALAKVESDTLKLRELKAKLPAQDVAKSAVLLQKAVNQNPESVSAWGAVAQMVSYRSDLRSEPRTLPDCFTTQGDGGAQMPNMLMRYHDCTINLDNTGAFNAIVPHLIQGKFSAAFIPRIFLENGAVAYSGGRIIRFQSFTFRNCTFNLKSPTSIPPLPGRALSERLLIADLEDVSFSVPNA